MARVPAADYRCMEPDWSRPPAESTTPEPPPSEEMIKQWLAEGLSHAEMAVRLGISVRDLKERVERLRPRSSAEQLEPTRARYPATAEGKRRRPGLIAFALGATALVAVVGAGAFLHLSEGDDDERDQWAYLLRDDDLPIVVLGERTPTATPGPRVVLVNGVETVFAGRLFWTSNHPTGIASTSEPAPRRRSPSQQIRSFASTMAPSPGVQS